MKRKFLILSLLSLCFPAVIFAQSGGAATDWFELIAWFGGGFISLEKIVQGVLLITQLIKKWFKTNGIWTKIVAYASGLAIAAVGKLLISGLFIELGWLPSLAVGVAGGLAATKVYTIEEMKAFLGRFIPKYSNIE